MEHQLQTMREELALLKSSMTAPAPPTPSSSVPDIQLYSPISQPSLPVPAISEPRYSPTPLTPVSQYAYPQQPSFVEGSSNHPYGPQTPSTPQSSVFLTPQLSIPSISNSPSPLLMPAASPTASTASQSMEPVSTAQKRPAPSSPANENEDEDENTNDPDPAALLPRKRLNGHDKRCLTIQVCPFRFCNSAVLLIVFAACYKSAFLQSDES